MESFKKLLRKKTVLISFCFILSFGVCLRFYGLSNQSLWNDELDSWRQSSSKSITELIEKGRYEDVHPPGYQILLFLVEKYIGDSESILRLPSAIAGTLAVLLIFILGTRLYSYKEGLIASAMMAFSWCPIYYSQEARPYAFLLLFTLISTYLWIHLLKTLPNKICSRDRYVIFGYVVAATITSYLHYFGLFLIALQGLGSIIFFFYRKSALRYSILIYFIIFLAYSPWWPTFWLHLNKGPIWIDPPNYTDIFDYLAFCFNDSANILYCILPFYAFFFDDRIRKLRSLKEWKNSLNLLNPTFIIVLWLIVPFSLAYIKSIVSSPILTNRNLIISLPALYLLLARSITAFTAKTMYMRIVPVGIVVLLMFDNIFIRQYYSTPEKEQFREAVNYIVEYDMSHHCNSMIVGYAWHATYFNYYLNKKHSSKRVDLLAGQKKDIPILSNLITEKDPKNLWFISAHRIPDEEFLIFLENELDLVESKKFYGANVWLFKNQNLNIGQRSMHP